MNNCQVSFLPSLVLNSGPGCVPCIERYGVIAFMGHILVLNLPSNISIPWQKGSILDCFTWLAAYWVIVCYPMLCHIVRYWVGSWVVRFEMVNSHIHTCMHTCIHTCMHGCASHTEEAKEAKERHDVVVAVWLLWEDGLICSIRSVAMVHLTLVIACSLLIPLRAIWRWGVNWKMMMVSAGDM